MHEHKVCTVMHMQIWAWSMGVATMANESTLFVMLVGHAT